MAVERAVARKPSAPERRPAVAASTGPTVSPAGNAAQQLQRRLGNAGAAAFVIQRASDLRVSSPADPAEREATATAARVMRMTAPAASVHAGRGPDLQRCACEMEIQREADGPAPATPAPVADHVRAGMSGGSPLPEPVRSFMEPRFGADFGGVRIHTGERAAQLSASVNAQAFTVGNHVFFGRGQYQPDQGSGRELIAHELTHTIQQGGSVPRAGDAAVQRQEDNRSWWQKVTDFGEQTGWTILQNVAPAVVPLVQNGPRGFFDWLTTKVSAAVEGLFSAAMAPVRTITGIGPQLAATFGPIVTAVQTAAAKIAQNDCSPLREAAAAIERAALAIITPIVEKLQPVVLKVKNFLNAVWEKIGAPIWEWIKQYAADEWAKIVAIGEAIQAAANWIWKKTEWIRSLAERAWVWLKNKIGIGDGPEGQDGILQWIQRKAEAAWAVIKAKIEPFKRELIIIGSVIGAVALAVSPAGPILAIGAAVGGAIQGLRWIAANWGKGNLIVQARVYLEKTLIPSLLGAITKLTGAVTAFATSVSGTLGHLAAGLGRAVGAVAASALSFVVSAVQWIADQAVALSLWAEEKLGQLTVWVTNAVGKLKVLLQRMLAFFKQLADVILDIYGLPVMLAGEIWDKIPACVRDPVVDFIGPLILRQIELFSELAKDDDAWKKTKADIANLIKLVFKDHDLVGAVKAAFHLVLRVFNVPPELLSEIGAKAMAAWDVVSKKPLEFIKNTVRAIGHGFRLLWANIWENLKFGLQGWLFGELKEQQINPPKSWTDPKDLFFFALEVMGITVNHMWELLAKRFDPVKVAAFRKRLGQVVKVLDWINKSIDTTKSPKENAEGIWKQAKDFGASILQGIAEWVAGKVAEELAILAAAAAASGGLSEVVDIVRRIYKAFVTAKRYMRRILDMVNQGLDNVLDIATGKVEKVGAVFEKIMKMGMPVVIGFLAEQVGLGGVGQAMRDTVTALRAKVDEAILWFIDQIKAAIEAIIGAVKAGVAALLEWWREKRDFQGRDGQPHSIYFEGGEQTSELVVATRPKKITTYLNELIADGETDSDTKALAQKALDFYEDKIAPVVKMKPKDEEDKKDPLVAGFAENLTELSEMLMEIVGVSTAELPPEAGLVFNAPAFASAKTLSTRTSGGGDKDPYGEPKWWTVLQGAGLSGAPHYWKRMHMITHQVGGEGHAGNLLPAQTAVNSGPTVRGFERDLEALVKRDNPRTKKPNVVWVYVEPEGFHPALEGVYEAGWYITGVRLQAGLNRPDDAKPPKWIPDPTPMLDAAVTGMQPPDFEGLPLDINTIGREFLVKATKVTPRFAIDYILPEREKGPFQNFYEFEARMMALRQELGREEAGKVAQAAFDENVGKVGVAVRSRKIRFGES